MEIKGAKIADLERELARTKRVLAGNKGLMPMSLKFYRRRLVLLELELAERAAHAST